jgi:phosphoglycerol transferase MdoB-like AlkP superfamily enzyme
MMELLSGAWVTYAFGTLVFVTALASLFTRDKRMIAMALIVLSQWLVTLVVVYAYSFDAMGQRIVFALLNSVSFLALIQFNRGKEYDPNLWAFVAIFFDGAMLPAHFSPLYDWLGWWWHALWINICYLLVILTLLFGISHRLYLDWKAWRVYRYLGDGQRH